MVAVSSQSFHLAGSRPAAVKTRRFGKRRLWATALRPIRGSPYEIHCCCPGQARERRAPKRVAPARDEHALGKGAPQNKRAGPRPCSNENDSIRPNFVLRCSTEIFGDFRRL